MRLNLAADGEGPLFEKHRLFADIAQRLFALLEDADIPGLDVQKILPLRYRILAVVLRQLAQFGHFVFDLFDSARCFFA